MNIINTSKTLERFSGISAEFTTDKGKKKSRTTLKGTVTLRTDAQTCREILKAHESPSKVKGLFNLAINGQDAVKHVHDSSPSREDFCGGTYKTLSEALLDRKIDISGVEASREKLKPLTQALQTGTALLNKRRRVLSEYDGDWDFDRKWDASPFCATTKQTTPVKSVQIVAEVCASCFVSAKDIDEYASFIVCLIEKIEATGITCGVTLLLPNKDVADVGRIDFDLFVEIKKPGQYLTTQDLKAFFSTNWFRRIGFWFLVLGADLLGFEHAQGLGQPRPSSKPIEAKPGGVLHLSPSGNTPQLDLVLREVNKVLGN